MNFLLKIFIVPARYVLRTVSLIYLRFRILTAKIKNIFYPAKIKQILWQKDLVSENICIFHIYSRKLPENTFIYLKTLADHGIDLIVTNSASLDDESKLVLQNYVKIYMEIENRGMDFAGYKFGHQILTQSVDTLKVQKLIFCNDSVLVEPTRLNSFVKNILASHDDYSSAESAYDYYYHVCSWFFCVSNKVMNSNFFKKFWADFQPYHLRQWNIIKGECGITHTLINNHIYPTLIYNPIFMSKNIDYKDSDILLFNLPTARKCADKSLKTLELEDKFSIDDENDEASFFPEKFFIDRVEELLKKNKEFYKQFLVEIYSFHWHRCNLHLFYKTDFPFIKKDLFYKKIYTLAQLINFFDLDHIKNLHINHFYYELIKKKPSAKLKIIHKVRSFLDISPL